MTTMVCVVSKEKSWVIKRLNLVHVGAMIAVPDRVTLYEGDVYQYCVSINGSILEREVVYNFSVMPISTFASEYRSYSPHPPHPPRPLSLSLSLWTLHDLKHPQLQMIMTWSSSTGHTLYCHHKTMRGASLLKHMMIQSQKTRRHFMSLACLSILWTILPIIALLR